MTDHERDMETEDPRVLAAAFEGCEESRLLLHRRAFLGISAGLCTWSLAPRSARAAGEQERLLVVVLRGGMDGLHVVAPVDDSMYAKRRQRLALDKSTLLPLRDGLYIQPALKNVYAAYQDNQAAVVHAIAPPLRIRSTSIASIILNPACREEPCAPRGRGG